MKILFAIQGTGNGHISRAKELVPVLRQYGEVDLLVSGTQADVSLASPLSYRLHGFSFVFGKHGGVDHWKTYQCMDLGRLVRDIKHLPLQHYDLILNDFEPVTAWACKLQGLPSVALSHQASFLSKKTPRPGFGMNWAELLFRWYAPTTSAVGFHYKAYDDFIHTPIIRSKIRGLEPVNGDHVTVYLPAFADDVLIRQLGKLPTVRWEVFSKHSRKTYQQGNVHIQPIEDEAYCKSLAHSAGLLTGGGFEGPAEALFLGKKVFMIP